MSGAALERVAVAGATGFVGQPLTRVLARDCQVVALGANARLTQGRLQDLDLVLADNFGRELRRRSRRRVQPPDANDARAAR